MVIPSDNLIYCGYVVVYPQERITTNLDRGRRKSGAEELGPEWGLCACPSDGTPVCASRHLLHRDTNGAVPTGQDIPHGGDRSDRYPS